MIDLRIEPGFEPGSKLGAADRRELIERAAGAKRRFQECTSGREAREHVAFPADRRPAVRLDYQLERVIGSFDQRLRASVQLFSETPLRCGKKQSLVRQPR